MVVINTKNRREYANRFCSYLVKNKTAHVSEISKELGLTEHQVKALARWIKDCSRTVDYNTYINWYPVPFADGYTLLKDSDIKRIMQSYQALKRSSMAEIKRLEPLKKYLLVNGIDPDCIEVDDNDYSEAEIKLMNEFATNYGNEPEKETYWG